MKTILKSILYFGFRLHSFLDKGLYSRMYEIQGTIANFPRHVHPENINLCNAQCPACVYPQSTRPKMSMASELFEKIVLESAREKIDRLWIYMFGEPLLDTSIGARVAFAQKKGIRQIHISTNASLLTSLRAKELIDAGLNSLTISLDSLDKDEYQKIRTGLDFDGVIKNIDSLLALPLGKMKVTIQFIGIEKHSLYLKHPLMKKWKKKTAISFIPAHDYAGQAGIKVKWPSGKRPGPCPALWNKCVILTSGEVPLCCFDFDAKYSLGNIRNSSIADVWNSPVAQHYRKLHLEGRTGEIPLCKNCRDYTNMREYAWYDYCLFLKRSFQSP